MNEWEDAQIKVEGKCEECKKKRLVAFVVDPYLRREYNEQLERYMCKECFEINLEDD